MFSTLAIQQAYGDTALHAAAQYGHEILIPMLLEAGAEIDSQDNNGRTPLHIACFSGEEAAVRALLKGNPDVKLRSNDGMTALDEARQENQSYIIQLFSEEGFDMSGSEGTWAADFLADIKADEAKKALEEAIAKSDIGLLQSAILEAETCGIDAEDGKALLEKLNLVAATARKAAEEKAEAERKAADVQRAQEAAVSARKVAAARVDAERRATVAKAKADRRAEEAAFQAHRARRAAATLFQADRRAAQARKARRAPDPDRALWEECSYDKADPEKISRLLNCGADPNMKYGVSQIHKNTLHQFH